MNFDFLDEKPDLFSPQQQMDELTQLSMIADTVGSYRWTYKPEFQDSVGVDGEEHIGPTAQQLQQIPGLDSAVSQDENGNLIVDTNYLSLATMGLLAALTRIVLGGKNDADKNISTSVQESTEAGDTNSVYPADDFPTVSTTQGV